VYGQQRLVILQRLIRAPGYHGIWISMALDLPQVGVLVAAAVQVVVVVAVVVVLAMLELVV
jgi:hypothetical protein